VPGQGELGGVQGGLVPVQQQQLRRAELGDLPAQLGPDGPPGPGDQHRAAGDLPRDGVLVELHGPPGQQVLQLHIPQVTGGGPPVDQLAERRQHHGVKAQRLRLLGELADQRGFGVGEGNDEVGGPLRAGHRGEVAPRAADPHPVDPQPGLGTVVVQQGVRDERAVHVEDDVAHQLAAGVAGAEQDDPPLPVAGSALLVARGPHGEARGVHGQQGQRRRGHRHAARHHHRLRHQRPGEQAQPHDRHRAPEVHDLLEGPSLVAHRVGPKQPTDHELGHDGHPGEDQRGFHRDLAEAEVEAHPRGQPDRDAPDPRVGRGPCPSDEQLPASPLCRHHVGPPRMSEPAPTIL